MKHPDPPTPSRIADRTAAQNVDPTATPNVDRAAEPPARHTTAHNVDQTATPDLDQSAETTAEQTATQNVDRAAEPTAKTTAAQTADRTVGPTAEQTAGRIVGRRSLLVAGGVAAGAAVIATTVPTAAYATPTASGGVADSASASPQRGVSDWPDPRRVWPLWPRRFVARRGSDFTIGGTPWRFAGTNTYYLHYKSHYMIDNALLDAAALGLKVVRCWVFSDGDGSGTGGVSLQPAPYEYNEAGFEAFDYAVFKAGQLGIRLVVALTNNWGDFGGIPQYATWFGAEHDDFFRRADIKAVYQAYARHVINRRNRYTGVPYHQEPTVLTWELANEPRCPSDKSGDTLVAWADEMSRLVKRLAPRQLVAVGDEGFYGRADDPSYPYSAWEGVAWPRLIALPAVDYGTYHLYPQGWGNQTVDWATQWIVDHITDGRRIGKPTVLEEFGWNPDNDNNNTDEAAQNAVRDPIYLTWTTAVEHNGGNGDQFWLLTSRQDDGTLYPNYDGYRVVYPSSTAALLAEHAKRMAGATAAGG